MRKILMAVVAVSIGVCSTAVLSAAVKKSAVKKAAADKPEVKMIVADFNSGASENNIGAKFGAWDKDPNDPTQGCKTEFSAPGRDGKGRALSLRYDVDSPNPAYNGFWMKLADKDIRAYSKLVFWMKGDRDDGFTSRLKVELKDMNLRNEQETSAYYIDTLTSEWQKFEIPLVSFGALTNKARMTEFVIVFEDSQATEKAGHIYLDDVEFVK